MTQKFMVTMVSRPFDPVTFDQYEDAKKSFELTFTDKELCFAVVTSYLTYVYFQGNPHSPLGSIALIRHYECPIVFNLNAARL